MDAERLQALVGQIERGDLRLLAVDAAEPSPMAAEILGARPWAFLDDAPLEERRARAVAVRRALPQGEASRLGALDPEAIAVVAAQVFPEIRGEEELHDALLDLGLLPAREGRAWAAWMEPLVSAGRAARLVSEPNGGLAPFEWWVAAERAGLALAVRPALSPGPTSLRPALAPLPSERPPPGAAEATTAVVRGWVCRLGPLTAVGLAERLGLDPAAVTSALEALEAQGLVLRGHFLPGEAGEPGEPHWCERGALARIHRLTLGRLRREIEPASAADLVRFLARWQHVAPGTQLHGAGGLAQVVGQLQGFHAAAGAWERDLLRARVADYRPALLDRLCLAGEVAWGRLAPGAPVEPRRRRSAPGRAAPLTLARRDDLPWLLQALGGPAPALTEAARALVDRLARRGASFLGELSAEAGRPSEEVERALWKLVGAGVATCDGFDGLRSLLAGARGRARPRWRAAGGRWGLLRAPQALADGALAAGEGRDEEAVARLAEQYLLRYGVVFRDLLARECRAPPWRELARLYRGLEARGALRGGRFVAGFSGEQFALPEAVEALRAARRLARTGGVDAIELGAADPLNLAGIVAPGPRIAATAGDRVRLVDGALEVAERPGRGEPRPVWAGASARGLR